MTRPDEIVATKKSWNKLRPMPKRHTTIPLDFGLNAQQATRVRQGFIPSVQEEKWFTYFAGNTLYQHRSWTGICIDQIHFVEDGDGLRASHAEVNRYAPNYSCIDDNEDKERIVDMVMALAALPPGAKSKTVDPLVTSFLQADQPGYLGSPEVLNEIVTPYFAANVGVWRSRLDKTPPVVTYQDQEAEFRKLLSILRGDHPAYNSLPGWHSVGGLGQAVIKYFNLNVEYCSDESLEFILAEGLSAISLKISELLKDYQHDVDAEWTSDALPKLNDLQQFVVAVLQGTNVVLMPGNTLGDFKWREAS